jgi:SNF2 family DNA or RNA helicase
MATPLAAAMLAEAGLSLDEPAKQLANLWWEGQLPAKIGQIAELLFTFKTTPWPHQQRAMSYAVNKPATMLALSMGTGKSLTTLCLLQAWKSNFNLILCPKSVMGVWRREFHKHCNVSHNVTVLDKGTSKAKAEELKEAKRIASRYTINAVVINYESSWREHIGEALLGMAWDCVVADESHRIKEMSSNQSKFAGSLAEVSSRRLALTGTVMPRGAPIEVLGQYRFLEPAIFGTTKTRFQDKYCIMDSKVPGRVLSYINQDDFMERFGKIAYRVQSKDVLTLPAIQQITIPVELEPKTRRYYETMKKECILELERGEVTAKNAAVKVMRLHQIACGHSKMEDGTIVNLGTEKRDVLMDMIEDISADEPIVVFCKFLEDLKSIEYVANKLKRRYGEISGARKDLTSHSTMPDNIDIMGVQVKAGGTGLDLTRARYMFWLSACDTWGDFDQAIARVHRPGQEKPVFVYHLAATNTVDIKIYRSLRNQEDVGLRLLEALDHKDEEE